MACSESAGGIEAAVPSPGFESASGINSDDLSRAAPSVDFRP
jgi:hypothetical protein